MQYIVYDLGSLKKGSVAEVKLSAPANVRLIDKVNLDYMKHDSDYRCFGGYAMSSPYWVSVPESKHWYLLIDLVQHLQYSVAVYPPRMSPD